MSCKYVHRMMWTCDGCGVKVFGWDTQPPEGWSAEHLEKFTLDYCPECAPSEKTGVPRNALLDSET